ncbi:indole-3-glycerol phosphate synthase TrpC [Rhodocaloribacter litoris]|uniref:indole-3-glycerol phosphate synthase TrpC n=1 Tax=Rhodocaloribacter litoris TaxID=2558931 RepID=UPI001422C00C|nr:indole-3-glycerol phosphate synthase TrpC [Rhodocaloribacter litoris]QXD15764.1 indole-3-glycerol phosphate synthase TrpC [Rhodocaloribacter litoris]GIV60265.1 MAG: indole-3-glycerol phosphate synthase [Rhodothermaceae bacterium]
MSTLLDQIVAATREVIQRRRAEVPPAELEASPFFHGPTLSLERALRREHLAVIAEIKKASPSRGVIRPDFDVADLARQYKAAGADAVSVLTEPAFFQGSPEHLALARRTIDLPLLRKDFILDPYQLVEARALGADAVLLIAAVLERDRLHDLHQAATELGLSCLVEVHDLAELDRIDFDQVRILGVNNRNLRTFAVNVDHALEVFAHVPEGIVRVAESGLRSGRELAYLRAHGVDAVLIGETLMRAPAPGDKLRALRAEAETHRRPPQPARP